MAAEEQWISVAEAAHTLKKSERTIRRQCESGKLKARIETTESGKTWRVCLNSQASDDVSAAAIAAAKTTDSGQAAATFERETDPISETAAIVAVTEAAVALAADNREVLAEVDEIRNEVGQIKAFLVGQMSAQSSQIGERLAVLPTRDNLREDVAELMGAALSPVMQRLEELAKENAQLETQLHQEKQKQLAQVRRPWWKKMFS